MKPVLLVLLIILAKAIGNGTTPSINFWQRPKIRTTDLDTSAVLLEKDKESGCLCKEVPKKWVICFGKDSCKKVPKQIKITTPALRIKTTLISQIFKNDFQNLSHLNSLEIVGNYRLDKIEGDSFKSLQNLGNLSISYNTHLKVLEPSVFHGLINLKELFLVKNGFMDLKDVTPSLGPNFLPNLLKLGLSENNFSEINIDDFEPLEESSLRELNLVMCQIEYMHPESLTPLMDLRVLRVGENAFNSTTITEVVRKTVEMGIPLQVLNLYGVGFRKSPPRGLLEVISNTQIVHLCLASNQFEVIKDNTFPEMPNLEFLDLSEILAINITENAFKGLPNLHTLYLSGNKLPYVPRGVLLEQLKYLDLSDNSGNLFSPSYFSIEDNMFQNMSNLEYLNLSYNRINSISNSTFRGLVGLTVLGLKNATIFHISEGTFSPLNKLLYLNLENNPFPRNKPLRPIFQGLRNLQILHLGGCGITSISSDPNPFGHLNSLKHLGLENNNLVTIPPSVLKPLGLESLDLSKNLISAWQENLFNDSLRSLQIAQNKLTYFTVGMLKDFNHLKRLDIFGNPFTCECSTFEPLLIWMEENHNSTILELFDSNPSLCVYPDITSGFKVVEFFKSVRNNTKNCNLHRSAQKMLTIALISFLVVLVIICGLVYFYRWHIRYWLFLIRLSLFRRGRLRPGKKLQSYTNYQYDAFVSYSNEDQNFVVRLVAMLENCEPYLKLCVYERDFQIGSIITENVLENVALSRRTLLIISDSYARSQWCRWEAQLAENNRLFFGNDNEGFDNSLVIVKLGEVASAHMTPTLRYLMKTRVYLQWDPDPKKQQVFWDKLRCTLAPPKVIAEIPS